MNSGDPFEKIVSDHYEPLYRFAMSLTRSDSDAMDLTQQTFYVWAKKGHQLRDPAKVKSWLYTTLHRAFLQWRRKEIRFSHSELDETSDELPEFSPAREDSSQALVALARVDEVFQSAVALFYLEDCSYTEIAAILEVPLGTVKSRLARGVAQLRQIFLAHDSSVLGQDAETASKCETFSVCGSAARGETGSKVPSLFGNDSARCDS